MKKSIYVLLAMMVFSCVVGCRHKGTSQLDVLESAIGTNPDSAYSVLDSIRKETDGYSEADRMRYGLLRLKCQNILDLPFDSRDTIKAIADYYADHGTYNEALLSTYLLGRAYMTKGDDPMAVECFNKCFAIRMPENQDVDYIQLSKVHSQLYEIYRNQQLHELGLNELNVAKQCAIRGGDSLLALIYEDISAQPYYNIGMLDSAINISTAVREKYLSINNKKRAAEVIYMAFVTYIKKKEYAKAKYYMDIFERESGVFDSNGNIESGREIFYYLKGQTYEGLGRLDSAEYQYRRLLAYRQDNNNIEAATKGLLSIYRTRGDRDSIGKYADWYCEANDSAHAQLVSEDVARLKAMYDYSEYKQKMEEMRIQAEETKTRVYIIVFIFACLLFCLIYAVVLYRSRKEAEINRLLAEYDRTLQTIEDLHDDKEEMLRCHQTELEKIRNDLKTRGVSLSDENERYVINDDIIRRFDDYGESTSDSTEPITTHDWQDLFVETTKCDSRFMLLLRESGLSENERKVAVLIRLHFKDYQIKRILDMYGSSLPNFKARINKKLFNQSGAKTLRRLIYACCGNACL